MLKFRVNTSGPIFANSPKRKTAQASKRALTKTSKDTIKFIKSNLKRSPAPNQIGGYKTGKYKRSLKAKVKNSFEFVLVAAVPYSDIVEYGRKASSRKVKPRRARALKFKFRGQTTYSYRAWTKPFRKRLKGTGLFAKAAKRLSGKRSDYVTNMKREMVKEFGR
jgi:hypothetical protein